MRNHRRRAVASVVCALAAAALTVALLTAPAGASGPAAKRAPVTIKGFEFHPKTLTISKGTRVGFTNKDRAKHTATDRGVFNTGKIKHGKTVTVRFKHKGTFKYICTIHPFMHGKIVVK